jgi:hypothetical protein
VKEAPRGCEVPSRVLGELVRVVSSYWTKGYEILGPAATTAGVAVMGISVTEMLVRTVARVVILYAPKRPRPQMLAAVWGTAFQVVSLQARWALECGERQERTLAHHMKSRVGGVDFPAAGGDPAAFN